MRYGYTWNSVSEKTYVDNLCYGLFLSTFAYYIILPINIILLPIMNMTMLPEMSKLGPL